VIRHIQLGQLDLTVNVPTAAAEGDSFVVDLLEQGQAPAGAAVAILIMDGEGRSLGVVKPSDGPVMFLARPPSKWRRLLARLLRREARPRWVRQGAA
jgi:hypothetical protein